MNYFLFVIKQLCSRVTITVSCRMEFDDYPFDTVRFSYVPHIFEENDSQWLMFLSSTTASFKLEAVSNDHFMAFLRWMGGEEDFPRAKDTRYATHHPVTEGGGQEVHFLPV